MVLMGSDTYPFRSMGENCMLLLSSSSVRPPDARRRSLCVQKAYARVLRAYSSSNRERRAATWLRPGPPRASRQSEDEEGDKEPLLLLEAGDISSILERHSSRLETTSENSGLSSGQEFQPLIRSAEMGLGME